MKILNFTAIEVLPALLDKSKTQTIRPAWNEPSQKWLEEAHIRSIEEERISRHKIKSEQTYGRMINTWKQVNPKPPRFKVGDKVKLLWNQRSKYKLFCKVCGMQDNHKNHIIKEKIVGGNKPIFLGLSACIDENNINPDENWFNKLLGTAEITEVFKIEMKNSIIKGNFIDWGNAGCPSNESLAKEDGFVDTKAMFKYFDKNYDLSTSKEFHVYRYKWHTPKK